MKKKILKFILNLLLFFFGSSILAVIVLRFIPVYFTPLMFIRTTQQIIHGEDIKWKHSWIPHTATLYADPNIILDGKPLTQDVKIKNNTWQVSLAYLF